jgi:hypothetical protein
MRMKKVATHIVDGNLVDHSVEYVEQLWGTDLLMAMAENKNDLHMRRYNEATLKRACRNLLRELTAVEEDQIAVEHGISASEMPESLAELVELYNTILATRSFTEEELDSAWLHRIVMHHWAPATMGV